MAASIRGFTRRMEWEEWEWRRGEMRTRLRCKKCGASLTVEGPATGAKVIVRPVTCLKCQEVNDVQWPADGKYEVTVET